MTRKLAKKKTVKINALIKRYILAVNTYQFRWISVYQDGTLALGVIQDLKTGQLIEIAP